MNPLTWTKAQWDAAGRHVLNATSTVIPMLVMIKIINSDQGAFWASQINVIFASIGALCMALGPIYTAIQAARSAAPEAQAAQTIKNLDAGVPLNGKRDQLISAVASQPDVAKVEMVNPARAETILNDKVV